MGEEKERERNGEIPVGVCVRERERIVRSVCEGEGN